MQFTAMQAVYSAAGVHLEKFPRGGKSTSEDISGGANAGFGFRSHACPPLNVQETHSSAYGHLLMKCSETAGPPLLLVTCSLTIRTEEVVRWR